MLHCLKRLSGIRDHVVDAVLIYQQLLKRLDSPEKAEIEYIDIGAVWRLFKELNIETILDQVAG